MEFAFIFGNRYTRGAWGVASHPKQSRDKFWEGLSGVVKLHHQSASKTCLTFSSISLTAKGLFKEPRAPKATTD